MQTVTMCKLNYPRHIFNAAIVLVLILISTVLAQAQSPRFVSAASGADANLCTLLAPCRTFAGAMGKVDPGGEIIVLDSGEYGKVEISKPVSIIAPDGVYAGISISSSQNVAVIVNPSVSNAYVLLRGLTLNGSGSGTGIGLDHPSLVKLRVERCTIDRFSTGLDFRVGGQLFVTDSTFSQCDSNAILVHVAPIFSSGLAEATIERCRFDSNFNGVNANSRSRVTVRQSTASNSSSVGFLAHPQVGDAELNLEDCVATNGNRGVESQGDGNVMTGNVMTTVRVSNSTITNNQIGVASVDGGNLLSRKNNTVEGNVTNGSFTGSVIAK